MRRTLLFALLAWSLGAQPSNPADVSPLLRDFRAAVQNDSLDNATALAERLDIAVQQQLNRSLIRDAKERTQETLSWLPGDIESFWVNQEPFTLGPDDSPQLLFEQPIRVYSVDRLLALDGGAVYRSLAGRTVRLVAAAAKLLREPTGGIPGPIGAKDVVYFYYFDGPITLTPPNDSISGKAAWKATAKVDAGEPFRRGVARTSRADDNWIVLAKPDLLILSNRRELISTILGRIAANDQRHALPGRLPEWTHLDQSASFWGLRHHQSTTPQGNRPQGVTVQADQAKQSLVIQYLSPTSPALSQPGINREFQIEHPQPEVWQLSADTRARGAWPVHFAMTLLGFGVYP